MPVKRYNIQTDRSRHYFFDDFGGANWDSRIWDYYGTVTKLAALGGQVIITAAGGGGEAGLDQQLTQNYSVAKRAEFRSKIKLPDPTSVLVEIGLQTDSTHLVACRVESTLSATWRAVTVSGSETVVDTLLAIDTSWHDLRIMCETGSIKYFIDNVLKATIATNIPAGAFGIYYYVFTEGANARSMQVDWAETVGDRD